MPHSLELYVEAGDGHPAWGVLHIETELSVIEFQKEAEKEKWIVVQCCRGKKCILQAEKVWRIQEANFDVYDPSEE